MRYLLLGVLILFACGRSGGLALDQDDCHPRKLMKMDGCRGEDRSFQECMFYFRASGVPDRAWCERLMSRPPSEVRDGKDCNWDTPDKWIEVPCASYGLRQATRCFRCTVAQHEAGKTYVYGYDPACARGFEQVTCNWDPEAATKLLAN